MSERVSNERASWFAQYSTEDEFVDICLDLLDSRARVRELKDEVEKLANGFIGLTADNLKLRREAGARVKQLEGEIARCADELDYEARHLRGVLRGEEEK